MLGFTPPEWAYVTTERTQIVVSQGAIRSLDRRIRIAPTTPLKEKAGVTAERLESARVLRVPIAYRRIAQNAKRLGTSTRQSRYETRAEKHSATR